MKRSIILLIALSLAIAGLLAYQDYSVDKTESRPMPSGNGYSGYENTSSSSATNHLDADKFLVPELYDEAWFAPAETTACHTYRGGLVNHHALASDLIVKIMRELARCRPDLKTVIIISPDHYGAGSQPVSFSRDPYQTNGELVTIDQSSLDRLIKMMPKAGENDRLFDREHGVGVLIPFLHHVLPDVSIVPIVARASIDVKSREQLETWLASESKNSAFILVSSDMSHYLDKSIAIKNDEATKQALVDSDTEFFVSAKDGFTDNGPSIAATINALKPTRWALIDQAISSDYAGSNGFTTTYLIGFWD
jgi:AmmeMemoRadiSam system protein B